MTVALVRVENRGVHIYVSSPIALATVLFDLEFVSTLVPARRTDTSMSRPFGVLGLDLDSKQQRMSILKRRELSYTFMYGLGSCTSSQVGC